MVNKEQTFYPPQRTLLIVKTMLCNVSENQQLFYQKKPCKIWL